MKKILKISAIVLFIIIMALAYYYFFFAKSSSSQSSQTQTNQQPGQNPFPFGQGSAPTSTPETGTTTSAEAGQNQPLQAGDYLQKLRLITSEPVAGATFVENKTGVTVRYMERATGHIYDVSTNSSTVTEISNTTIPKIYETLFTDGGSGFITRYIGDDGQTIETLYGKI